MEMSLVISSLLLGALVSLFLPQASLAFTGFSLYALLTSSYGLPELVTLLVGLASLVFGLEYIKQKELKNHFFSAISLFLAAMIIFIQAESWLSIYLSWEMMAVCSYLLIAHYSDESARSAARKSFVIGRISGLSMLLAIAIIYAKTGSFGFTIIPGLAAFFLVIAAFSKSSQFPFNWLLDAMRAPAPASALLHSATMVAAGPLLLYRFSESFLGLAGFIKTWAIISIVISSLAAMVQEHQKRMLAHSTVSTIGILYLLFDSALLPVAFSVHALLKASFFVLIGTYAAHYGYTIRTGLNRRSISSLLTLFLIVSLAGVPGFGLSWFKSGYGWIAALTVFLSLSYFFRFYFSTFSGKVKPKQGIGTSAALVLCLVSVPLSLQGSLNAGGLFGLIAASILALLFYKINLLTILGELACKLLSIKPNLTEIGDPVEQWGYWL
ncbi:MAG: hypothetical protein GOU99_01305, partial [Candidatus Altiarchaeota archaeon]|nr:hypothetical protein [Candidatus Altiarchaeota archaeon]